MEINNKPIIELTNEYVLNNRFPLKQYKRYVKAKNRGGKVSTRYIFAKIDLGNKPPAEDEPNNHRPAVIDDEPVNYSDDEIVDEIVDEIDDEIDDGINDGINNGFVDEINDNALNDDDNNNDDIDKQFNDLPPGEADRIFWGIIDKFGWHNRSDGVITANSIHRIINRLSLLESKIFAECYKNYYSLMRNRLEGDAAFCEFNESDKDMAVSHMIACGLQVYSNTIEDSDFVYILMACNELQSLHDCLPKELIG